MVGFVYLNNIDWFSRNAEFGILIGERSKHGKGLAREALSLLVGYAFESLNLHKLYLRVVAFNDVGTSYGSDAQVTDDPVAGGQTGSSTDSQSVETDAT